MLLVALPTLTVGLALLGSTVVSDLKAWKLLLTASTENSQLSGLMHSDAAGRASSGSISRETRTASVSTSAAASPSPVSVRSASSGRRLLLVEGQLSAGTDLPQTLAAQRALCLRHTVFELLGRQRKLLAVDEEAVPVLLRCPHDTVLAVVPRAPLPLMPATERVCRRSGSPYADRGRAAGTAQPALSAARPAAQADSRQLLIVESTLPVDTAATVLGEVSCTDGRLVVRTQRVVLRRGRGAALALLPRRWWAGAALTASALVALVWSGTRR